MIPGCAFNTKLQQKHFAAEMSFLNRRLDQTKSWALFLVRHSVNLDVRGSSWKFKAQFQGKTASESIKNFGTYNYALYRYQNRKTL